MIKSSYPDKKQRNRNNPLYIQMNSTGLDKWTIKIIKEIQYTTKSNLLIEEDKYINLDDNNCLNKFRARAIIRREDFDNNRDYEKARYQQNTEKDRIRAKKRWLKILASRNKNRDA